MKQKIAFRRSKFLCESRENAELSVERINLIESFLEEFERFGVKFSEEVLRRATTRELKSYIDEVLPELVAKYHGSTGEFKPLWPGFPRQVRELSEETFCELQEKIYSGAISYEAPEFSYYSPETGHTQTSVITRDSVVIECMELEDFIKIPAKHCSTGVALSVKDLQELGWFLKHLPVESLGLPEKIPFKETLVFVMDKVEGYTPGEVTDVLRYYFAKSGSELGTKTGQLKSLSRPVRKKILGMLEEVIRKKGLENCIVDAKRHTGSWLLMGKGIHAGDYKNTFSLSLKFFKLFREDRRCFKTWNSLIQVMYGSRSIQEITREIYKRPGEFLRRFDSLLRRMISEGMETTELIDLLRNLRGAKNKTLLEILYYYGRRGESGSRVVKLRSGKTKIISSLKAHDANLISEITAVLKDLVFTNIHEKFKIDNEVEEKPIVVLDKNLEDVPVPLGLRNQDVNFPIGTSLDIPGEVDYIRFFVHWIQEPGKFEDLDMHGSFYSADFNIVGHIGWNSTCSSVIGVYSGDVRGREGACAEYVDVDIKGALKEGYRYVSMDVFNYEGRGLDTLPCWLGYEYRSKLGCDREESNDLEWSPKNPQFMIRTECKDSSVAAWCFDLEERKAYLINTPLGSLRCPGNNAGESIIQFVLGGCKQINCRDILKVYYESTGHVILSKKPEEEIEDLEVITKDDLLKDYSKILEILGD